MSEGHKVHLGNGIRKNGIDCFLTRLSSYERIEKRLEKVILIMYPDATILPPLHCLLLSSNAETSFPPSIILNSGG